MIRQTQGSPEPRTYAGWLNSETSSVCHSKWGDFRPTWMWLEILSPGSKDSEPDRDPLSMYDIIGMSRWVGGSSSHYPEISERMGFWRKEATKENSQWPF